MWSFKFENTFTFLLIIDHIQYSWFINYVLKKLFLHAMAIFPIKFLKINFFH
jgi:hypothetical protein